MDWCGAGNVLQWLQLMHREEGPSSRPKKDKHRHQCCKLWRIEGTKYKDYYLFYFWLEHISFIHSYQNFEICCRLKSWLRWAHTWLNSEAYGECFIIIPWCQCKAVLRKYSVFSHYSSESPIGQRMKWDYLTNREPFSHSKNGI